MSIAKATPFECAARCYRHRRNALCPFLPPFAPARVGLGYRAWQMYYAKNLCVYYMHVFRIVVSNSHITWIKVEQPVYCAQLHLSLHTTHRATERKHRCCIRSAIQVRMTMTHGLTDCLLIVPCAVYETIMAIQVDRGSGSEDHYVHAIRMR